MKPKNFKCPFTWEARRPMVHDRVLFVPEYYDRHQEWIFPGWENSEIFGRKAPIEVEYCSGNGAWIIEKARAHPERNWVAVEIQFERVRKIWSKMRNENLSNLLIVCGEALTFTRYYVPKGSISQAYVNFPDPWPKQKHAQKRLLQEPFLSELAHALIPGGMTTIATDHKEYALHISEAMHTHPLWRPVFAPPYYITEWENYGNSYFGDLWREQGLEIHYLQFSRTAS